METLRQVLIHVYRTLQKAHQIWRWERRIMLLTLGVELVASQQPKSKVLPDHRCPGRSGGQGFLCSDNQLRTTSRMAQTQPAKHHIAHHYCSCFYEGKKGPRVGETLRSQQREVC